MNYEDAAAIAWPVWILGVAIALLVGAFLLRRRGDNTQAALLLLVAIGATLYWAGVYP